VARISTTPLSSTERRTSALTLIIIMNSLVGFLVMAIRAVIANKNKKKKGKSKAQFSDITNTVSSFKIIDLPDVISFAFRKYISVSLYTA
jgi:hypothetical protein